MCIRDSPTPRGLEAAPVVYKSLCTGGGYKNALDPDNLKEACSSSTCQGAEDRKTCCLCDEYHTGLDCNTIIPCTEVADGPCDRGTISGTVIRSGRIARSTQSFLNGSFSSWDQSSGNFSVSGVTELNHSRKRPGASCMSDAKPLNSSRLKMFLCV